MFTGSGTFYDGSTTTLQDVNNDGELDLLGQHIAPAGTFFIEQGPVNDVVLQWDTFIDAADEAGISRLYGGIHIQDGDLRGRELGRKIGVNAYDEAMRYINGTHEGDDSRIVAVCEDHDGDGYGWNGVETCIPDAVNPNPGSDIGDNTVVDDPSLSCLDPDGDGYGWNGVETCFPDGFDPQPVSDIRVDMVAGDQLLTCIDSDGDGYGWNGIESCQPVTPDDEVRNIVCVDADGDGYGWTGSQSCRFDEDGSIVLL